MIFAAGLGTRLKPLTDTLPKALIPVAGKPLLQHVIEKLKAAGCSELIINVHHLADRIIRFVKEKHSFNIHIAFSDEREQLLDTGGGIKKAAWFFDDGKPFLIHNTDILSNLDLARFYADHLKQRSPASLVCSIRPTSRYLLFDDNNRLTGWINEKRNEIKSPLPHYHPQDYRKRAFSGIHIFHPALFRHFNAFPDRFSIIDFYLSICDKEKICCYLPHNLRLLDMGKPETLRKAPDFLAESRFGES